MIVIDRNAADCKMRFDLLNELLDASSIDFKGIISYGEIAKP